MSYVYRAAAVKQYSFIYFCSWRILSCTYVIDHAWPPSASLIFCGTQFKAKVSIKPYSSFNCVYNRDLWQFTTCFQLCADDDALFLVWLSVLSLYSKVAYPWRRIGLQKLTVVRHAAFWSIWQFLQPYSLCLQSEAELWQKYKGRCKD
jgi:hypothetical protein